MTLKVENPHLVANLLLYSTILIFFLSGGVYIFLNVTLGRIVFGVFFILVGIGGFMLLASRDLVYHPKSIDFDDEGIVLELPLGRKQLIRWQKVTRIYAHYGDPNTLFGRLNRAGGLEMFNRLRPIDLTYELAFVVRDEYFKRYGEQVNKVWRYSNRTRFR